MGNLRKIPHCGQTFLHSLLSSTPFGTKFAKPRNASYFTALIILLNHQLADLLRPELKFSFYLTIKIALKTLIFLLDRKLFIKGVLEGLLWLLLKKYLLSFVHFLLLLEIKIVFHFYKNLALFVNF